ncbi:MAG: hypothetical protein ACEPO8_00920 [Rhodothermaceae bacterium]
MKKTIIQFLFILLFVSSSFAKLLTNYNDLKLFLDEKERIYEEITNQYGLSTWYVYSQEGKPDLDTPSEEYAELFSDEKLNQVIDEWYSKLNEIKDEKLKIRVVIWKRILTAAKVNYDDEISGYRNQLEEWISNKKDPERPSEEKLSEMVLDLMKMRNAKVKELGYSDYGDFILELSGQGIKSFYSMIDEMLKTTDAPYNEILSKLEKEGKELNFRNLMPYFRFSSRLKIDIPSEKYQEVLSETLSDIGMNYKQMPIRFVDKQIPYGGNCISVNIPKDVRIVCLPAAGLRTRMHELGHGLQTVFTEVSSPMLKGYEWCLGSANGLAYFEGMAETIARFYTNPVWLKKHTKLSDEEIKNADIQDKYMSAVSLRFSIANFLVEFELYKNLDKDPNEVQNAVYKRIFKGDLKSPRPVNLASVFYVAYPCYVQNYLIADIISWQVHKTLKEKFGENFVLKKETGEFLKKYLYNDGVTRHWQKRLSDATGKKLDITGYLKYKGL